MTLNWIVESVGHPLPTGDPAAVAISIDGRERRTYGELQEGVLRYARALDELGIRPGDRVGVLLANCPDYFELYFAIARAGAIAVRLNWRLTSSELEYALTDSGCRLVFFHPQFAAALEPIAGAVEHCLVVNPPVVNPTEAPPQWARPIPDSTPETNPPDRSESAAPVMIMYTSGTTGRPKGAIWTQAGTLWCAAIQVMKFGFDSSTVALTTGPFYHAGAFEVFLLPALLNRGRAVGLSSGSFTTDRLLEVLATEQVTHALLYPFMLTELLGRPTNELASLGSLKYILAGGDPIAPWAIEAAQEKLVGVELVMTYGLTEGGASVTYLDGADMRTDRTSVGRPAPLTEVRINADSADGIGEIEVRSPAVSTGYWNNPEATAATFVDGWCRTGDLGRVTESGRLIVTGRKKDMIRSGGENIYPVEVEQVLTKHPGVAEVAVVAVHDRKLLEVGCAVVRAAQDPTPTAEELRAWSRQHLAGYKCPRYFVFVDDLPRNAVGKVLKPVLRERYADIGAGDR